MVWPIGLEKAVFDAYCTKEGARTLLGPRNILSLHNTSEGVVVYYRCHCGQPGVVLWGRLAEVPARDREPVAATA